MLHQLRSLFLFLFVPLDDFFNDWGISISFWNPLGTVPPLIANHRARENLNPYVSLMLTFGILLALSEDFLAFSALSWCGFTCGLLIHFRIKSLSSFTISKNCTVPFSACLKMSYLFIALLPQRFLNFCYAVALGLILHIVLPDFRFDWISERTLSWQLVGQVVLVRSTMGVLNVLEGQDEVKRKLSYGNYWYAEILPIFLGCGQIFVFYVLNNFMVRSLICLGIFNFFNTFSFALALWIVFVAAMPRHFSIVHTAYHNPFYWTLLHWVHHLQNCTDNNDGFGDGPEEGWYYSPVLLFPGPLLHPVIFTMFWWALDANDHDTMKKASEVGTALTTKIGVFDSEVMYHQFHHFTVSSYLGFDGRDRAAERTAQVEAVAQLPVANFEPIWLKRMFLPVKKKN